MARVVTYECNECGCEVVVTETSETELSPIYCCGFEVTEVAAAAKKPKKGTVKKAVRKVAQKVAKKKVAKTKKVTAKKKTSKRS